MAKKSLIRREAPVQAEPVDLPLVSGLTGDMLVQLTDALGVDRSVIALDDQIEEAWSRLPRLIRRIPPELRDEKIVKTCIAIASGLFDSAINYVWNAAIVELREKVRRFGLHVVPQILTDKSFDEATLLEMRDAELLDLCLKLNLITDQDFFFLDQCRATRNSFSVAHPSSDDVDEDEVVTFISRCQKHALSSEQNPQGVDTKNLLVSLKGGKFKRSQREAWQERLRSTYDAQRELIFSMLHGIYCDPDSDETTRVNALALCIDLSSEFTPKVHTVLVDQHQDYRARGKEKRYRASQDFFEKLGLISLLAELEVHGLIVEASKNLLRVHNGWDNFYNEPPFAIRLELLTKEIAVPGSAQGTFVEAVVTCGVGNEHGVSGGAYPKYLGMVRSFSPREIQIMLTLPVRNNTISGRIKSSSDCRNRFVKMVKQLDRTSVPTSSLSEYKKWLENS